MLFCIRDFACMSCQDDEGPQLARIALICCTDAVYELWTGKSAFPGLSKVQVMVGVVSSSLRPAFPTHCPSWYSALAAACWAQAATSRYAYQAEH